MHPNLLFNLLSFMSKMLVNVVCSLIALSVVALALDRGDRCVTPNGETARCRAVSECTIIKNAIVKQVQGAATFARKSQCGLDSEPLVCCGTFARDIHVGAPSCVTPNGESARCIPASSCDVIVNAVRSQNTDAIEFAKNSQCGYDSQGAKVCCGSEAYPLRTNLLPDRSVCGVQKADVRVYGGNITEIGEFPWMTLLRYKYFDGNDAGFRCGGALINNRYILTAAHCVSLRSYLEMNLDSVRLGEWRISTVRDCDEELNIPECAPPVVDVRIEEKILHPNYVRKSGENDIALLRLEKDVKYTDYVHPICLPVREAPDPKPGTEMHVAGWGATENASYSDYKMKVPLPIVARQACNQKITKRGTITPMQICAGGEAGKDSCQGDSGGPLMHTLSDDLTLQPRWYQEGIVSRGLGCGIGTVPGVYTRVAKYMDWIISNLK